LKKEKARRNISLDPEINELCRELKINVSKECNNFLKMLVNIEDSDEGEILRKIIKIQEEIRNKTNEMIILQNMLQSMKTVRLEDKENNLAWNKVVSEYRTEMDMSP
jgi:DNA polymerase III delta prime subunit